jgi:D-alanyl-D-alanine carboxypeptidase (penicillin-binding protein 5/6)
VVAVSLVYAADAVGKGSTMRRAMDGVAELVIGALRAGAEKL